MKKGGVLNPKLASMIASCQHGDKIALCDSGFPIPHGADALDLSITVNMPRLLEVMKIVLTDLQIEGVIVANEMEEKSKWFYDELRTVVTGVPVQKIPHEQFKELIRADGNIAFVRTGEATPFANVILVSGVIF